MLDAYASLPHYWRHLAPIVDELRRRDVDVRTWAARDGEAWGARFRTRRERAPLALVASYVDARALRTQRAVYVEHGAGQRYVNHDPGALGWPGSRGLDNVRLFVCPGEHVASAWRDAYPQAAVETVGSPYVDALAVGQSPMVRSAHDALTVAFSFRWNCGLCPEARTAFDHYERAMPTITAELASAGVRVLGHGHPRLWERIRRTWARCDVELTPDFADVVRLADVFVADNTSALYEWAALDRPVVVLNAPWYRRDVEHGLRFWSHVPGIQVDDPGDVVDAVSGADRPEWRRLRLRAMRHVYAHRGDAAVRAADAIQEAMQWR